MRSIAETYPASSPERAKLVADSKRLRDPGLTVAGRKMAATYASALNQRLRREGVALSTTTTIGCSGLRRARETAELLWGGGGSRIHHFPHIKEFGNIPENTPKQIKRCRPDFRAFLRHIHTLATEAEPTFCVVGHGSFLFKEAWPSVTENRPTKKFSNLDGFLVKGDLDDDGRFVPGTVSVTEFRAPSSIAEIAEKEGDSCDVPRDATKKRGPKEKMRKQKRVQKRKTRKLKKQKGGGSPLPLAWFQPGAQFIGTSATPTGTGVGNVGTAIGSAATQRGGGATQKGGQRGGFSPSIMGAGFTEAGLRLLPAAAYMGFNQFKNYNKTRRMRRGQK